MVHPMRIVPGTLLNNRYHIIEILGQGGMGSVYRAIDQNLGVEVAVKDNLFTTDDYARQFRREAVILATLRHPNLPRVTDHFVIEGQGQYLVMDYIEGEDLRQRMDRIGLITDDEAVLIGAAICDALTYLGTRNPPIVHRDIKPGNVRITPHSQIYLVDFGLAKDILGSQITTSGARAMTPGYSPPEQYGTARTDQRTDIYSLGATLYAALTGFIPEDAMNRALEGARLIPIRRHNPRVSRRLTAVIEKSLAIRPIGRYQTAEEFKQDLLSAISASQRKPEELLLTPMPGSSESVLAKNNSQSPKSSYDRMPNPEASISPVEKPILKGDNSSGRIKPATLLWGKYNIWLPFLLIFLVIFAGGVIIYLRSTPTFKPFSGFLDGAKISQRMTAIVQLVSSPTIPTRMETGNPTLLGSANFDLTSTFSQVPSQTATPTSFPSIKSSETQAVTATLEPTRIGGGAGQIAFASERSGIPQIWLVSEDGRLPIQVTDVPEGACQPTWSPDGRSLIFVSPCTRHQETYPGSGLFLLEDIDDPKKKPIPLSTDPGGDYDPAWSPDGKQIAFTSERVTGSPRIFILNLADKAVRLLSEPFKQHSQPAWSRDGSKIAFVSYEKGSYQIIIMSSDGVVQSVLSEIKPAADLHPDWSPDGNLVIFTQYPRGIGVPHLAIDSVVDPESREFAVIQGTFPAREAKYSPDGLWLVFEAWPLGSNHEIYIMSTNGALRRKITDYAHNDFDPTWRPAIKKG